MLRKRNCRLFMTACICCVVCLMATTGYTAEITGAFGYTFGEELVEQDILIRRQGMGPHDIVPKKKAGTVKTVQAYIAPKTNTIFALEGINTFPTMGQCTKMVTMITFFLGKKYADVISLKENIGDGSAKSGVKLSDTDTGKIVMVTCTGSAVESKLSIRYGDVALTEQALTDWKKAGGSNDSENGLSL